jgi:hypothetical protein
MSSKPDDKRDDIGWGGQSGGNIRAPPRVGVLRSLRLHAQALVCACALCDPLGRERLRRHAAPLVLLHEMRPSGAPRCKLIRKSGFSRFRSARRP